VKCHFSQPVGAGSIGEGSECVQCVLMAAIPPSQSNQSENQPYPSSTDPIPKKNSHPASAGYTAAAGFVRQHTYKPDYCPCCRHHSYLKLVQYGLSPSNGPSESRFSLGHLAESAPA